MHLTHCPECDEPLEASLTIYLDQVSVVMEDGYLTIVNYGVVGVDYDGKLQSGVRDDRPVAEALRSMVRRAEGNELRIYCRNDHDLLNGDVEPSDPNDCAECARSRGPHYRGPCEHI